MKKSRSKDIVPIITPPLETVRFIVCDIEAYNWTEFLVIGLYDIERDFYKYFTTLEEFNHFAFEYCKEHNIRHCFSHFGGKYDFNFIISNLLFKCKDRFIVEDIIPRGSGLLSFCHKDKFNNSRHGFFLTHRDSSAIFPMGLKRLAQSLKVETQKGSVDFRFLRQAWNNEDYTKEVFNHKTRVQLDAGATLFEFRHTFSVYYKDKKVKRYSPNMNKNHIKYYNIIDGEDLDEENCYYIDGRQEILHYLEGDCKSLAQCLKAFYEWPMVKKSGPAFTTASQAVKVWRTFLKEPVKTIGSAFEDGYIRKAYLGGRTEVFKTAFDGDFNPKVVPYKNINKKTKKALKDQLKAGKELYYLDVNSLYPTVMLYDYPDTIDRDNPCSSDKDYDPNGFGVWQVEVFVPKDLHIPPLGVNHTFPNGETRYIFPTGRFTGHWTIHEIEYAKTLGVKVLKYIDGLAFKNAKPIFKEYIETLYAMRMEAKKIGDGAGDQFTKLLMNSLYGKLGMTWDKEEVILNDYHSEGVSFQAEFYDKDSDEYLSFFKKGKLLQHAQTNIIIPCYVTSYARILMHKTVLHPCGKDIYYTDTDSVQTTRKIFQEGQKLGELKLEYKSKSACFLLPKTYLNSNIYDEKTGTWKDIVKSTMKGFERKKTGLFTYIDFFEYLSGELKSLSITQDAKFATFKSAIRNGSLLEVLNDPKRAQDREKQRLEKWESRRKKAKIEYDEENYSIWLELNPPPKSRPINEDPIRSIRSSYNKRIISDDMINTTPIHLGA